MARAEKTGKTAGHIKRARLVTSSPTRHLSVISPIAHLCDSDSSTRRRVRERRETRASRRITHHAARLTPLALIATRAASLPPFFFLPSISPLLCGYSSVARRPSLRRKEKKKGEAQTRGITSHPDSIKRPTSLLFSGSTNSLQLEPETTVHQQEPLSPPRLDLLFESSPSKFDRCMPSCAGPQIPSMRKSTCSLALPIHHHHH
jgi:hypothetical protein